METKEVKETKICKHCQTEIPKKAKVCPQCRKKQGGIVKWVVIGIVVFGLFGSCLGGSEEDESDKVVNNSGNIEVSTQNSILESNETETEIVIDNTFEVGEYLETDYLKISYISCEEYKSDNQFIQPKDGYVYYRLEFEFENIGESDQYVSSWDFVAYADGYAVESTYFDDDLAATISAGKKAKGAVYFEVPTDAEEVIAEYELNYWTEDKVIFIIK